MRRVLIALAIAIALAGCGSSGRGEVITLDTKDQSAIDQGAGSKDASADVKLTSFKKINHGYGSVEWTGQLLVTNYSEKPSDYYIEISILNKAGDNVGYANATVAHLNPGQKARTKFSAYEEEGGGAIGVVEKGAAYKAVIHEIQRTEAL